MPAWKTVARRVDRLPLPLSVKIHVIWLCSRVTPPDPDLVRSADGLEVGRRRRRSWAADASWGLAAGELIRERLADPSRQTRALDVIESADLGAVERRLGAGRAPQGACADAVTGRVFVKNLMAVRRGSNRIQVCRP